MVKLAIPQELEYFLADNVKIISYFRIYPDIELQAPLEITYTFPESLLKLDKDENNETIYLKLSDDTGKKIWIFSKKYYKELWASKFERGPIVNPALATGNIRITCKSMRLADLALVGIRNLKNGVVDSLLNYYPNWYTGVKYKSSLTAIILNGLSNSTIAPMTEARRGITSASLFTMDFNLPDWLYALEIPANLYKNLPADFGEAIELTGPLKVMLGDELLEEAKSNYDFFNNENKYLTRLSEKKILLKKSASKAYVYTEI